MPCGPVIVIAPAPQRLRQVFDALPGDEQVVFADDLADAARIAPGLRPRIVLMFKDTGFDGPQFRRIAHLPSVRWVHVGGSGYEYLEPITRDDLTISNGQGLRSRHLAETVTGAMLALNGNFHAYARQQRARVWRPISFEPVATQTLLVVGTGAVGGWVARNGRALGMRVIGASRAGGAGGGGGAVHEAVRIDDLAAVLPRADVVSVHLRHTPDTERLFDARLFGHMKTGALFINTARGAIVDQPALVAALEQGRLRGAYLDVFAAEPLPRGDPLWRMPNVMVTPHASDSIADWDVKATEFFIEQLARWRAGHALLNVVRTASR